MTSKAAARARRENTVMLAAVASALAIPGVPMLVLLVFLVVHVATYRGVCGPYPIDTAAYACGFGEYMINFANPYAVAGFITISIAAAVLTAIVLVVVWSFVAIGWAIRVGTSRME